jgi:hypothetical protein
LHELRHTHGTLLIKAGLPVKVVSERLGHGDVAFEEGKDEATIVSVPPYRIASVTSVLSTHLRESLRRAVGEHRLPGCAVGGDVVSAAEHFDLGVDTYASKDLGPEDHELLDPCGCGVSVSYAHSQGVAVPRPFRGSAAIDWLADRNPLTVTSWDDPVVEAAGHHVRSVYVETFWLPTLGPSATWVLRRLASWLEAATTSVSVDVSDLAIELGLGGGTGRSSPIIRTLARLAQFQVAAPAGDAYAVRRHLAPLPQRLASQLPGRLAAALQHADRRVG